MQARTLHLSDVRGDILTMPPLQVADLLIQKQGDSEELLLWYGKPSASIRLEWTGVGEILLSWWFFFISLAAIPFTWREPNFHVAMIIPYLFFSGSIYFILIVHFWKAFERSRTVLALTNKRAIIKIEFFGRRKLKSYPISKWSTLELVDGKFGSVFFATEIYDSGEGTTVTKIGFEMIENAQTVFSLFKNLQENHA